jgi:signal transduction histidine kinase
MDAEDRAARLLQAGMVLASELSLPAVLQSIVELAVELTEAHYGAVGVLGSGEDRIAEFITTGISDEARALIGHIPQGHGVLGQLIDDPRPLRLPKVSDHPSSSGFPANHPPMTTFLGAPVMGRGQVFGNIYLTEKSGDVEFTREDEDALVILAAQAGVAVANARIHEESERRRRSLEAVSELSERIISGEDTARVLVTVAANARELVHADLAMIVGRPPGAAIPAVMVADGHAAEQLRGMTVPADGSISGEVMRTGRPMVVEEALGHPHAYEPLVTAGDMGPSIFVPLRLHGQVFGTLLVANRRLGRAFSGDDVALVQTFANQASVALENASAKEDRERLSLLDERERIGRELHDGVIQSLFAVGMSLQGIALASQEHETHRRLDGAVEELDRAIRDLRNYIFGLRPIILADHHLDAALQELVQVFSESSGVVTIAEVEVGAALALAKVSADVIQLVREALSNVRRHARASTCRVSLRLEGESAILEIDDDGRGFDPGAARKGLGLDNLRQRAQGLGGEGKIESVPGEGTLVSIRLSVKADAVSARVSGSQP